jgi:hypothetical protein
MKKSLLPALAVLLLLSCGCATFYDHPDPKVSYPAQAGQITGAIVAIPVDVVLAPILYPIGAYTIDPTGKADGPTNLGGCLGSIIPSMVVAETLGNTVGACSWLLFGWWGNEAPESWDIAEAIFRYKFECTESTKQQTANAYFLGLLGDDPHPQFLKRFENNIPPVKKWSEFKEGQGLKFHVGPVKRVSSTKYSYVEKVTLCGTYSIEFIDNNWVVIKQ